MATREVDALLARFPGPVTVGIRRLRVIHFILLSLPFVAGGLWLTHQPHLYPIVLGWLCIAFFGGGGLFFLALLLPGAGTLELTGQGFTLRSLFRKDEVLWSQLIYLGGSDQYLRYSYEISSGVGESTNQPREDEDDGRLHIVDRTRRAFDNFGLPDKELVRLMQVWCEFAMYAPPFAIAPPGGGAISQPGSSQSSLPR